MNKKTNVIYTTDNFRLFKVLHANRGISTARVNTLINSIRNNGYIGAPIVVNENYEVIDGQGRLEACKALNVPIDYVVKEGLRIEDCRVLNQFMKNWTTADFIQSYADSGIDDYKRLLTFTKMGFGA